MLCFRSFWAFENTIIFSKNPTYRFTRMRRIRINRFSIPKELCCKRSCLSPYTHLSNFVRCILICFSCSNVDHIVFENVSIYCRIHTNCIVDAAFIYFRHKFCQAVDVFISCFFQNKNFLCR